MTMEYSSNQSYDPAVLEELGRGYMKSRIFLTAFELNIFATIGNHALSADQIAQQLGIDAGAIEIVLNALVSMGILEKSNSIFKNVKEIAELLVPDSPHYQGGILLYYLKLWDVWSNLTSVVKSGKRPENVWADDMRSGLYMGIKHRAEEYGPRLARLIDCHNVRTMLDVGGGPGGYSVAFAKHYPNLTSTLFDKDPLALQIAEKEVRKHQLQDRIILRMGDFFCDDVGNGFDLVFLSSIICLLGESDVLRLLNKLRAALNENGRIVIWDVIIDESGTKPDSAAIFAVNLLVNGAGGHLYSPAKISDMLVLAGFTDIYQIPLGESKIILGNGK